jgi:hypothetical protein
MTTTALILRGSAAGNVSDNRDGTHQERELHRGYYYCRPSSRIYGRLGARRQFRNASRHRPGLPIGGSLASRRLFRHSHNYQRFTRTVNQHQIPLLVAGCGGHSPLTKMRATHHTPYKIDQTLMLEAMMALIIATYA